MNARRTAAEVVNRVVHKGESLQNVLSTIDANSTNLNTVQALAFGAIRYHFRINVVLKQFLKKPLKKDDKIIDALLRVAIFELVDKQTPVHAILNESVSTAKKCRAWSSGLVNACLRRFVREQEQWENQWQVTLDLPEWIQAKIKKVYPEQARDIMQTLLTPAPLTIRVDTQKITRDDYLQQLVTADIDAKAHSFVESAIVIEKNTSITDLPGFNKGWFFVQDASAQLAAYILNAEPGHRVLDACAAPGGKTVHVLQQLGGDVDVLAIDNVESRMPRLEENIKRSGYKASMALADAVTKDWWDGKLFDRILLDAPCTASGIIRRQPDIKIHRQEKDLVNAVELQSQMLANCWSMLKLGGYLLYATCSIFVEENERQIKRFSQADSSVKRMSTKAFIATEIGNAGQILPSIENHVDGFYYALLKKV